MIMRVILFFLVVAGLFFGCSSHQEMSNLRKITISNYSKKDTLHLRDYIFCYSTGYEDDQGFMYSPRNRMSATNEDSIFNIFETSISKLELPLVILAKNQNRCDKSFHRNYPVRIWRMDKERILEIADSTGSSTVLVPFIRIMQRTHVRIQGDPATSAVINKVSFVNLVVLVLKNDQIIYRRSFRYPFGHHVESRSDPYPPIEQIHWDNLVRLAMEDYINRLK